MLHRFEIALADVDRGVYQDLDLRVARHPSEDNPYLLTRILAFALEHKDGLAFSKGLSESDEPAIWLKDAEGRVQEWIEVGAPAADRLHRASKACPRVVVWCHRRPDMLQQRCAKERVHKGDQIVVWKVPADLLTALERKLDRNNKWDLSRHEGRVTVVVGGEAIEAVLESVPLVPAEGA
ncbi:MAG: YaeQ family protein [Planctomycetes bacterium]|nr:YaeQ family protein [Planctomycetota bacterium]